MHTVELAIESGSRQVVDLTSQVVQVVREAGASDGLLSVFVPHATAGLVIMETGSGSEEDLAELLDRLLPRDDRYTHRHGSPGHGADHLLPLLASPSLTVPVRDGRPALGTWQRICLVDLNRDNPHRRVLVSMLPG
jgi:secondary thiamine-phosphate synthase enzyme